MQADTCVTVEDAASTHGKSLSQAVHRVTATALAQYRGETLDRPRPAGALVTSAGSGGLSEGDVVVALAGEAIESAAEFRAAVARCTAGDNVELEVLAAGGGEARLVCLELGGVGIEPSALQALRQAAAVTVGRWERPAWQRLTGLALRPERATADRAACTTPPSGLSDDVAPADTVETDAQGTMHGLQQQNEQLQSSIAELEQRLEQYESTLIQVKSKAKAAVTSLKGREEDALDLASQLEAEREKLAAELREQELVATRLQARVAELEAELAAAVELAAQAAGTQRAAADVHSLSAEQEELAKQNDSMTSCSDVHLVLDGQYDAFVSDERAKTAAIIADIATKLKLDPSRIAVGDHQAGSIILQVACLLHSLAFFGR